MPRDKAGHFYYGWYPTIFKADTQHLTLAEDAAYRRLIDHYMETRSPLINNGHALARIVGIGIEEWNNLKTNITPYFKSTDNPPGYLSHAFCDKMLEISDAFMSKSRINGAKGGRPKKLIDKENNPVGKKTKPSMKPNEIKIKESKKDSDTSVSGDLFQSPQADFKKVLFGEGLKLLGGKDSDRSFIGMLISKHGEGQVASAMLACQKESAIDPKSFITKVLQGGNNANQRKRPESMHSGFDKQDYYKGTEGFVVSGGKRPPDNLPDSRTADNQADKTKPLL